MLSHFEKLKTPLKSVFTYQDLKAQQARFANRGWSQVDVSSLWQIWSSDQWLSADERRRVDAIEPFDEWEEFALFASHYCVVIARVYPGSIATITNYPEIVRGFKKIELFASEDDSKNYSGTRGHRRFGAPLRLRNRVGHDFLANTFGLGTNGRLRSYDIYTTEWNFEDINPHHTGPSSRMCHSITDLGDHGSLLTGGRTSPSNALRDCWLSNRSINNWQRVDDLPVPLYRHAIARLGCSSLALLVGGKSDQSTIFDGCLLYEPGLGWLECEILGPATYMPVFGGVLVCLHGDRETGYRNLNDDDVTEEHMFHGMLAGGISQNGTVADQILKWVLVLPVNGKPTISFETMYPRSSKSITRGHDDFRELVGRFGASTFISSEGFVSVVGGIIADGIVTQDLDILITDPLRYEIIAGCCIGITPKPLLIGTSAEMIQGQLVITGGGATCFSMGTYWNPVCYTIPYDTEYFAGLKATESSCYGIWLFWKVVEVTEQTKRQHAYKLRENDRAAVKIDIPRLHINTADAFLAVLKASKPVIIEGSKLGCCTETWSSDYIAEQLGPDKEVTTIPILSPFQTNQVTR